MTSILITVINYIFILILLFKHLSQSSDLRNFLMKWKFLLTRLISFYLSSRDNQENYKSFMWQWNDSETISLQCRTLSAVWGVIIQLSDMRLHVWPLCEGWLQQIRWADLMCWPSLSPANVTNITLQFFLSSFWLERKTESRWCSDDTILLGWQRRLAGPGWGCDGVSVCYHGVANLKWSRCVQIMSILARITIKTCSDLFAECVIRVTETPHVQTLSDFLNVSFVFWSQCQPDISHRILIKSFQNRNCIINYYRWWNLYITAAL